MSNPAAAHEQAHDPYAPVLEGPRYAPAPTHHELVHGAAARQSMLDERVERARAQMDLDAWARDEALRRAELEGLRRRAERVQERLEQEEVLLRDVGLGAGTVLGTAIFAINGAGLKGPTRGAAYLAAVVGAVLAGREWAEAAHRRRRAALEDEYDRCEARLLTKRVGTPAPAIPTLAFRVER